MAISASFSFDFSVSWRPGTEILNVHRLAYLIWHHFEFRHFIISGIVVDGDAAGWTHCKCLQQISVKWQLKRTILVQNQAKPRGVSVMHRKSCLRSLSSIRRCRKARSGKKRKTNLLGPRVMLAIIESVRQIKIYGKIYREDKCERIYLYIYIYMAWNMCVWASKLQLPGTFVANKSQAIIEI